MGSITVKHVGTWRIVPPPVWKSLLRLNPRRLVTAIKDAIVVRDMAFAAGLPEEMRERYVEHRDLRIANELRDILTAPHIGELIRARVGPGYQGCENSFSIELYGKNGESVRLVTNSDGSIASMRIDTPRHRKVPA